MEFFSWHFFLLPSPNAAMVPVFTFPAIAAIKTIPVMPVAASLVVAIIAVAAIAAIPVIAAAITTLFVTVILAGL